MENLWLKIKVWTKITLFTVVLLYIVIFLFENANKDVSIWVWFGDEIQTTLLRLVPSVLVVGVVGTLLTRTVLSTVGQWRELQKLKRSEQDRKDLESIKTRAGMLQTKPISVPPTAPPPSDVPTAAPESPTPAPPSSTPSA